MLSRYQKSRLILPSFLFRVCSEEAVMVMINHFTHPEHPLVLVDQEPGDDGSPKPYCDGCGEAIEGSRYSCVECGFLLHERCAELQREIINHPLHPQHPLILQFKGYVGNWCNVCMELIRFFYRCDSCNFDLDIRCALHPQFVAQEFQKLQHFSHPDHPLIFVEDIEIQSKVEFCSGCKKPMYKSSPFYCCPECIFYLHRNCAELPLEINHHPAHRKHPLMLLAEPPPHQDKCSCHLCARSFRGFVYNCSVCEVGFKAADAFLQTITAEIHEHPLTPISGTISFVCNACGTDGSHVCFTCAACNLIVHSDCTSLRRTIKITRHQHRLSHIYFFQETEAGERECSICHDEVNLDYGSYCCSDSDCNYFAHVNCAIDEDLLEEDDENQKNDSTAIYPAFEEIKPGEIRHICHNHNLIFSDHGVQDGQSCEGCLRSISTSFYHCAQCNFFLHKCCVELPKKVRHWTCRHLRELFFYSIFLCAYCRLWSSGFGYNCDACCWIMCIRCHEISDTFATKRHDRSLFLDHKYEENCCGCGQGSFGGVFRCKDKKKCKFALDYTCLVLPNTARYKYDNHDLILTFHDDHHPSQCYCDICEEERDPNRWFYHCADCDVSAHPECLLTNSPFVKLGKPFRIDDHEHPVTLVKIDFYPPKCNSCGKPCRDDLAIRCTEPDCSFIFHRDCSWNRDGYILHTY